MDKSDSNSFDREGRNWVIFEVIGRAMSKSFLGLGVSEIRADFHVLF